MNRAIAFLVSAFVLISLSVCSKQQSANFSSTSEYSPVTLSCTMFDVDTDTKDPIWTYLQERFNVKINAISVTGDDFEEKTRLLISSNDMPSIMWLDLDESNFSEYARWASEGMFAEWPSMDVLKEKYPNIYAQYILPDNYAVELVTIKGKQYAHPVLRDNPETGFLSGESWMYRRDWAKQLGLYREDDIYTWEEWTNLCRAFVVNDPGNNGRGKTIGMGTASYYFPDAFGIYQTSSEYGYGAFSPQNGKYVWTAAREETLEGLQIAKTLWDEGLIWQDNHLGKSADDQYTAGLMGMIFQNYVVGRVSNTMLDMKRNFPDIDEYDACALAKVIGPEGTFWANQSPCFYGIVVMNAKINDEVKTRFLTMLNWLYSDEGQWLQQYGIEGSDYLVEIINGERRAKCLWPESEIISGALEYPYSNRTWFYCYARIINQQVAPDVRVPQTVRDITNEKFQFFSENAFIRRADFASSYVDSPAMNRTGNFTAQVNEKQIELLLGANRGDLSELWRRWIASMMPRVQPVLDDLNSSIKDIPQEMQPKKTTTNQ